MASIARDSNHVPLIGSPPARVTLEETYSASLSSSVEVTLNASTTLIEVAAFTQGVLIKWGTDNASTTDHDSAVPMNTVRQFIVPNGITAVNVIEQASSAAVSVTEY